MNWLTNFFHNSMYFFSGGSKNFYQWILKFVKPDHWLVVPLYRLQQNLLVFGIAFWISEICGTMSVSSTAFWRSSTLAPKIESDHPTKVRNLIDLFSTDRLCQWSFETFQSLKQATVKRSPFWASMMEARSFVVIGVNWRATSEKFSCYYSLTGWILIIAW